MSFYTYSWNTDMTQEEITIIRIYCLSENNKSVCIRVEDFTPYVYIELPTRINWRAPENKRRLIEKLNDLLKSQQSVINSIEYKYKLYYANMNKDKEREKFPFLFSLIERVWITYASLYVIHFVISIVEPALTKAHLAIYDF